MSEPRQINILELVSMYVGIASEQIASDKQVEKNVVLMRDRLLKFISEQKFTDIEIFGAMWEIQCQFMLSHSSATNNTANQEKSLIIQ